MESVEEASLVATSQPETALVSVIVTTKNEEVRLGALLASLKAQSYAALEIIVVDNNSSDTTKAIASNFTDKVYNYGPERSTQRNYGVSQAGGQYVLILDADMELTSTVVEDCVRVIQQNPNLKALVVPEESFGEGFWAKCKWLERSCYVGDDTIEAARFFDKEVFVEFGGYDAALTGPEDWDLPRRIRQKYLVGRISSFIRHNEGNLKLTTLMRKKFYYAQKALVYIKKHNAATINQQTVYFFRPAFYRNWKHLLAHPVLFAGMLVMLSAELLAGGCGLVISRLPKRT
jgi:glycosyltransferase involved in cell wall biosynthesis